MTRIEHAGIAAVFTLFVGLVGAAQTPETLSEVERLKLELLRARVAYAELVAKYDGCRAEVGAAFNTIGPLRARLASEQLSADEVALKTAIETAHPGYTFDPKTGSLTKK